MFKRNSINVTIEELKHLFLEGKTFKKNEEPYMNFYEFMMFAINKESDQNFRDFIRKVKKRREEIKKTTNDKNIFSLKKFSSSSNNFNPNWY